MGKQFGSESALVEAFISLTECEEKEANRFLPLLRSSSARVGRRLENVEITEELEEELVYLSAAMAAEQWALAQNKQGESLKVGEISISNQNTVGEWRALVELLEAACAEILKDEQFFFRNVVGSL